MRSAVVARSLCRLRVFSLEALPAAERAASLRTQALGWQPFMDSQVVVGLRGAWGIALAWDRGAIATALRAAGCESQRMRLWPEPLLQAPLESGVRLLRGIDGYEAQHWREGLLQVSRWWPESPDAAQWLEFERLLPPDEAVGRAPPEPQPTELRAAPWLSIQGAEAAPGAVWPIERLAVGLGLVCLTAATAAVARQAWEAYRETGAQQQELQALRARSGPLLKTRDTALALQAEAAAVAAAMNAPLPLEVLQHLVQRLPQGVLVRELELTGSQLRLSLEVPAVVSQSTLMRELQSGQWLQDVRQVKGGAPGQALQLEMELAGSRPLATAPAVRAASGARGGPSEPPPAFPPGFGPSPATKG
ncbi:MAG: PilN domain-containing protein [Rubrivivax sp.]|nr:PilN domain-containing protein [Rubrivivax sp.]